MIPKLIDNARQWHKFWSVRVAALWGLAVAYLTTNPDQAHILLALLPDGPWRVLAGVALGFLAFATTAGLRVVKQPLEGDGGD